jgi:hypothetical protein
MADQKNFSPIYLLSPLIALTAMLLSSLSVYNNTPLLVKKILSFQLVARCCPSKINSKFALYSQIQNSKSEVIKTVVEWDLARQFGGGQ